MSILSSAEGACTKLDISSALPSAEERLQASEQATQGLSEALSVLATEFRAVQVLYDLPVGVCCRCLPTWLQRPLAYQTLQ